MSKSTASRVTDYTPSVDGDGEVDAVRTLLHEADAAYVAERALWDRTRRERDDAQHRADELQAQCDHAGDKLDKQRADFTAQLNELRSALNHERDRTAAESARAQRLAEGLKSIHRALFIGDVHTLLLRTCLSVTGATRGLFLTGANDRLYVRAAVGVEGYPGPASYFLRELCFRVAKDGDSLVWNGTGEPPAKPAAENPDERFSNFAVAPVRLLGQEYGFILAADKPGGFEEEDVENLVSVGDQGAVALENQGLQRELEAAYLSIVASLADAVEAKDPETRGHSERVARYARQTAERLTVDGVERGAACYGGLMHDVGKIGVSDGVLNKPGKLTPEEWQLMCSHVRVGHDLLENVPALGPVAEVVLHHHERYDGTGYPDGLAGDAIPLAARIVCVADSYCAMTMRRSYQEAKSPTEARAELERCRGYQFDPAVVDAFLSVLDAEEIGMCDGSTGACDKPPGLGCPEDFAAIIRSARKKAG